MPIPASPVFINLFREKRRELDRAKTAARIERELAQVSAMLQKGPVTTRQIAAATGLTDGEVRCRGAPGGRHVGA